MKFKIFAILFVSVYVLYSCSSNNPVKSESAVKDTFAIVSSDRSHSDSNESIELDNGHKWKVVPDMMHYIKTMETFVNDFSATKQFTIDEYLNLHQNLQENIDSLTSNCTMEGKAHDELHKWLVPYIELVDKLGKAKSLNESEQLYSELKQSFDTLNNYFE